MNTLNSKSGTSDLSTLILQLKQQLKKQFTNQLTHKLSMARTHRTDKESKLTNKRSGNSGIVKKTTQTAPYTPSTSSTSSTQNRSKRKNIHTTKSSHPTYLDTLISNYYDNDKVTNNYLESAAKRIHIYPPTSRVIVIGDIHGDFHAAIKCLVLAEVIKVPTLTPDTHSLTKLTTFFNSIIWIGGNTYVVQLGDQIDRVRPQNWDSNNIALGSTFDDEGSTLGLFYLFTYLDTLAKVHNGRVFSILGNHEIMNIEGDFRYVSKGEFRAFGKQLGSIYSSKSKYPYHSQTLKNNAHILSDKKIQKLEGFRERLYSFAPTGICANLLAVNYYTVLQIGSWIFCHGGPTVETLSKYNVELLNNIVSFYLLGLENNANDIKKNYYEIVKPKNHDGILWSREYSDMGLPSAEKDSQLCKNIDNTLQVYNSVNNPSTKAHHIAVGHSPQYSHNLGINSICGGRVWRCDVGMSKAFNERKNDKSNNTYRLPQVLEIINDTEVRVIV